MMLKSVLSKFSAAKKQEASETIKPRDFEGIQHYCMFIGYARSGHSLVGALLDAHPTIIISSELDALKYIRKGISRERLFSLILARSYKLANQQKSSREYSYKVPNQWNGKYRELKVIGDRKGAGSALKLRKQPHLLSSLRQTVAVNIKFIHVTRNPFDNISTMSKKNRESLDVSIRKYFELCQTVNTFRKEVDADNWINIRNEEIIMNPYESLIRLCAFLEQGYPEDYLGDCASIIYKSPHKSRLKAPWNDESIQLVHQEIEKYPFLRGYKFDN